MNGLGQANVGSGSAPIPKKDNRMQKSWFYWIREGPESKCRCPGWCSELEVSWKTSRDRCRSLLEILRDDVMKKLLSLISECVCMDIEMVLDEDMVCNFVKSGYVLEGFVINLKKQEGDGYSIREREESALEDNISLQLLCLRLEKV